MKTIDRFFITNNVCVPLDLTLRYKDCPHTVASKNLYPTIVEKDIADIEVEHGNSYCWNSCSLTTCISYISNRK